MLSPVMGKVRVGAHVEVFRRDRNGRRRLVQTSRPGEVCEQCGGPPGPLIVASPSGSILCSTCRKG